MNESTLVHPDDTKPTMVNNFVPNGLSSYSEETIIPRVLNRNRWLQVEERTLELLGCIQPNKKSETLRNNVTSYIKGLMTNHVPCQVFQFGSVPLKTYLPDGDIDLTVFGINQILPQNYISEIQQKLQNEINNESAKFRVKEVQLIKAEVKIIKCLIENIVIDISFNQLSGLSALCFFEEVDNLIGHNHIFKQSIILVKAWCYHESRLLGSNSGLFSTYAIKVLVLYIFNLYGNGFAGPLEVLFRFLEFYNKFDWKNYCISLRGPVPLSSLPNMTAESPRKDCKRQDLLLTECFLNVCESFYGNMPRNQEEKQFVPKHINIIDPLRADNNLGRSISKGSFYRIRSALKLGADRMVRLLDCTDEYLIAEFDYLFKNTWNRHGNGSWIHVSLYNLYIRKVGRLTWQESEDEQAQASNKSDGQLKESNQMSDAYVVSQTQSSSSESAPIDSEAQNQCCNVFVSETESELVHFSSSMSDSKMGSSSTSEVLDNLSFGLTSCDLRSEDAVKSKNHSNMGLHKEEPDCTTITESSRTLHTLMDHSVDKEERGGVGNMTGSSKSGYLEAVKGAKSNTNEAMKQQEEEHHFVDKEECGGVGNMTKSSKSGYLEAVKGSKSNSNEAMRQQEEKHHSVSTAENCKNRKYLDALLGVKKIHASFSPPPQQNMPYSIIDKGQFPELKPPQRQNMSINVGKDNVDPPAVVIKHGNAMNPAESCKYTPASDSTSEINLSSLPPDTTQPENVHGQSTVSMDIIRHKSTTSEINLSSLLPDTTQPENVHGQSTMSTTSEINLSSLPPDTTQPENVHGQSTVSTYIVRHESTTSEINLPTLHPDTTQPENVHGQSNVSTDIVKHESTTSESIALNAHALQSPCAFGSSVLQFPFKLDNISHAEPSNYLLNQCFDILYGDFESYWVNLKYGQHCVNGHSEEPVYFPPTVELPMDFQAQYYWNMGHSGSVNGVPVIVSGMPPTFASDSHIEGINQRVSFWLPGSNGTGTFMPNPLTYMERQNYYKEHQNANNIFDKKEAPHQGEGEGSSRAVNELEGKEEAPHQGEGEGSSSAVDELENLEKVSKDNSPYQP